MLINITAHCSGPPQVNRPRFMLNKKTDSKGAGRSNYLAELMSVDLKCCESGALLQIKFQSQISL